LTDIPHTENEKLLVRQQSLADQVFEILQERINQGVFQSGNQLPTESQLAEELKVSRSTIRVAISRLEDRKLVQRRQGVGTYLRDLAKIPNPLNEFRELAQLIKLTGYKPGYSTFSDIVQPDKHILEALQLQAGSLLLRQRKIFTADGDPFIYVVNHIPVWVFENVISHEEALKPDLTEKFLEFFEITCGHRLSHFVSTVRAEIYEKINPPGELINDGPHTPVLAIDETGFDEEDKPVVHSIEFHPGNWMTFKMIRNVSK
jgi:GntR family transcriptional regulator